MMNKENVVPTHSGLSAGYETEWVEAEGWLRISKI